MVFLLEKKKLNLIDLQSMFPYFHIQLVALYWPDLIFFNIKLKHGIT